MELLFLRRVQPGCGGSAGRQWKQRAGGEDGYLRRWSKSNLESIREGPAGSDVLLSSCFSEEFCLRRWCGLELEGGAC